LPSLSQLQTTPVTPADDSFTLALIRFLEKNNGSWEGSATELLDELHKEAPLPLPNGWPKAAHTLSRRLGETAEHLRAHGIELEKLRDGGKMNSKLCRLTYAPKRKA